ncbi:phosphate signaling complex protein PhoU [Parasphingorhabdus sp.]|uniref:phosphate signaling complex protein PhoU n=1 Tax=Parasphingorhabdus sp. TaxID=2709688 RepID=UPI00326730C6
MSNTGTEHTVKAFDTDINELRGMVAEIGGRSEQAIAKAMQALQKHDLALAAEVVAEDKIIDDLEQKIDDLTFQTIALRAPMADDLRELIATFKISGVVERIGDYAKNIAKRVPLITGGKKLGPISLLPSMSKIASELVRDSLEAFARRDAELALEVSERDQVVDDFYTSIFRAVITHMIENPKDIGEAAHLLFIAKNLERIGDHATNVAEMVYFAAEGEPMPERDRGDNPTDLLEEPQDNPTD